MTDNKQHEVFAGRCLASVLGIAVNANGKQRAVGARNLLVVAVKGNYELIACAFGNGGGCGHAGARLVNHVVVNFGRCYLDTLCFQRNLHEGCVIALKLVEFFVKVGLHEVSTVNAASCPCEIAHSSGCSAYLRTDSG